MQTLTPIQIACIVGGATLFILGIIILLLYSVYRNRKLTAENEADHEIHVARTAAAVKERDTWKNEATKLAAEKEALNARLETAHTDTKGAYQLLDLCREKLQTSELDRDELRNHRDELIAHRAEDVKEIGQLTGEIDYFTKQYITLTDMVRNLTAKLAEQGEQLEIATKILEDNFISKRGKGARDASGRFTTVDEQKEYSAPTPVKQLSEVNAENGYKLPAATFNNGGQVPAHGNEKKEVERGFTIINGDTGERKEPFGPTKYKAFPGNYIIPEGTAVFAISDSDKHPFKAINKKAVVNKCRNKIAECEFEAGIKCMLVYELAPLDPRQHPEHPEFKSAE